MRHRPNVELLVQNRLKSGKPSVVSAGVTRKIKSHPLFICTKKMSHSQLIKELRSLIESQRWPEACNFCTNLVDKYPNDHEIWMMCLSLYNTLNDIDSLAKCSRRFLEPLNKKLLTRGILKTCLTLIRIFNEKLRIQEVIYIYEKLITMLPDDAGLHFNLSLAYLLAGDFQRGWVEWEWRYTFAQLYGYCLDSHKDNPRWWDGSSLENKTLLVSTEQGHGDVVQLVRYLRKLKTENTKIILNLYLHPTLGRLLENVADIIIYDKDPKIAWDVQTNICSLPNILKYIPCDVPYLDIPHTAGEKAVPIIKHHVKKLRVGLAWSGNPRHFNDHQRSLKITMLKDLLLNDDIVFFSLQKGEAVKELKSISPNLIDLAPYLEDFADTAAAIQKLDLVISIDTSVAHLAGALGKPVWTLIPFVPDWRWMLEREDSPWYPTMRLFRQPAPGDWSSVVKRVSEELKTLAGAK